MWLLLEVRTCMSIFAIPMRVFCKMKLSRFKTLVFGQVETCNNIPFKVTLSRSTFESIGDGRRCTVKCVIRQGGRLLWSGLYPLCKIYL